MFVFELRKVSVQLKTSWKFYLRCASIRMEVRLLQVKRLGIAKDERLESSIPTDSHCIGGCENKVSAERSETLLQ